MARLLADPTAVQNLAERLARVERLDRAETPFDEPPTWTLAVSLSDIEQACRELLDEHLPQLVAADSLSAVEESLRAIHFDLQHVVYHLATTPGLRDLIDSAPPFREDDA